MTPNMLSDGKMLNKEIVKAGYASLMTIPPYVKYQERFLKAYQEARENKRGCGNNLLTILSIVLSSP